MNILNLLSSHYDQAFNNVLMTHFENALTKNKHNFETIDLYNINFNPVMRGDDFNQFMGKDLPAEILEYQEKVKKANVLTFFYPVWWCDMPAIMKGWIDRVFSKGFAYNYDETGAHGLLTGKKAILVSTFGNSLASEEAQSIDAAMRTKTKLGVFDYCGFASVDQHYLYDVYQSDEIREKYLMRMQEIAAAL